MSARLKSGGTLIDRASALSFTFNGQTMQGFAGDTLASALLANGQTLVGRSFKYHRRRGIVTCGPEEPNALVNLGQGARLEPNQRATTTGLFEGLVATSQNHWPSLEFDVGAINARLSRFLPAGFYYKTFIHPRAAWKHLFEPIIRKSAGLGRAPEAADPDRYEQFYLHTDVVVVGGGLAGLAAARRAADAGAHVLLVEQNEYWGGRGTTDAEMIEGVPARSWINDEIEALAKRPNVRLRLGIAAIGVHDHGYILLNEQIAETTPGDGRPRQRLWRVRARRIIVATGAIERPLAFAGNDLPGIMLASAVRDYATLYGVETARDLVVITNNDDAYRTAIAHHRNGGRVVAVIDARAQAPGQLVADARALGLRVEQGRQITRAMGRTAVTGVEIAGPGGTGSETLACDGVAMSGGWSPVVHLWSHCGGKLNWDEEQLMFRPDVNRPPTGADGTGFVLAAGTADGHLGTSDVLADAVFKGRRAAEEVGRSSGDETAPPPRADSVLSAPTEPVWMMPNNADHAQRSKAFLDFQNDVKVSDVALAAQEGFESVEHAKRYTTLGMATDQGKLSNINGLAILAGSLGAAIPSVGTTTFRPPWTPLTIGAIAAEATGPLFKPTRRTVTDAWAEARNAIWEPVSDWRRAFAYPTANEKTRDAISRECLAVRNTAGLLDASTLGKIVIAGPDAGRFLDLIYTNMMSTLKPGKCRYGLMLNENGFIFDDGVVVRLDENRFLCHTTTGGAGGVHDWMEEWLQTEWWDLKVYTANVTEQFAQFAIVGPNARHVLERLGGLDLSAEALPFMSSLEGTIGGTAARVHRISFSGELSYEIAVASGQGLDLWLRLLEAGADLGLTPYGTEAMHVLRAEKGFIIVGDETDGTVTPHDLGMSWIVSKKKSDFIGKRALMRSDLVRPDRKQLVGLETLDPSVVLPDGAHAVTGTGADGEQHMLGHVTSTYMSPSLGRSIAMGLISGGKDRMGQVLQFPVDRSKTIEARVVSPVFFDPEGDRQNV